MNMLLTKLIFAASFILLIIAAVLFYLNLGAVSNFITVGIDVFRGINFLGDINDVWSVLGVGTIINLINIALASILWHRNRFLAQLLPSASLLVSLLILISVGVIITTN